MMCRKPGKRTDNLQKQIDSRFGGQDHVAVFHESYCFHKNDELSLNIS